MKLRYVHACQICGKAFINIHGRAQMYCGSPCKHLASRGAVMMEKTCPCCGKTFRTFDGRMRFCSVECRIEDKRRRKGITDKRCIICGGPMPKLPGGRKTCGPECMKENQRRQKHRWAVMDWQRQKGKPKPPRTMFDRVCPECGAAFQTDNSTKVYCSARCASVAKHKRRNRRRPYARTCRMCGKEFMTERPFQTCCSRSCSMRWQHALGLAPRKGRDKLQVFQNSCAAADDDDMIYGNMVYF